MNYSSESEFLDFAWIFLQWYWLLELVTYILSCLFNFDIKINCSGAIHMIYPLWSSLFLHCIFGFFILYIKIGDILVIFSLFLNLLENIFSRYYFPLTIMSIHFIQANRICLILYFFVIGYLVFFMCEN